MMCELSGAMDCSRPEARVRAAVSPSFGVTSRRDAALALSSRGASSHSCRRNSKARAAADLPRRSTDPSATYSSMVRPSRPLAEESMIRLRPVQGRARTLGSGTLAVQ